MGLRHFKERLIDEQRMLFFFMLDDCVGALTAYNAILLGLKFDGCVLN